jgi:hypothetical protein
VNCTTLRQRMILAVCTEFSSRNVTWACLFRGLQAQPKPDSRSGPKTTSHSRTRTDAVVDQLLILLDCQQSFEINKSFTFNIHLN